MPVENGSRLTSGFGWQAWRGYTHTGLDFGGVEPGQSSPVYAPADGVVELAADGTIPLRTGPQIKLRHPDGSATTFGHTRNCDVQRGQKVRRGDYLAQTWHTGLPASAGIHLHFEWWRDADDHTTRHDPTQRLAEYGWVIDDGRLYDEWNGRPTLTPAATTRKDVLDMLTKEDLKAAIREVLAEERPGVDLTKTPAWRIKNGRQEVTTASRVIQETHALGTEAARAAGVTEKAIQEILDGHRENGTKEN